MRFTLVPSDAQDTAAARQLDTGFLKLEFAEPLEGEFRRTHRMKVLPWMRAGFAALGFLTLILWMLDQWQLPPAILPVSHVVRLVVMLPLAANERSWKRAWPARSIVNTVEQRVP